MSLADNLKALQTQRNLTTAEFAEKANLPVDTINKIRNGKTQNPNMDTLKRMAAALECSVDALIGADVPEEDARDLLPELLPADPEALVALFCKTLKRQTQNHEMAIAEVRHDRNWWRKIAILAVASGVVISLVTMIMVIITYWDLSHPMDGNILLGMITTPH